MCPSLFSSPACMKKRGLTVTCSAPSWFMSHAGAQQLKWNWKAHAAAPSAVSCPALTMLLIESTVRPKQLNVILGMLTCGVQRSGLCQPCFEACA